MDFQNKEYNKDGSPQTSENREGSPIYDNALSGSGK
jgi:hypothetical protein